MRFLGIVLLAAGCIGSVSPGENEPAPAEPGETAGARPSPGGVPAPAPGPIAGGACTAQPLLPAGLRLLTPTAYVRTLSAVVAPFARQALTFLKPDPPAVRNGFRNEVERLEITSEMTELFVKNAETAALEISANRAAIDASCTATPTAAGETQCLTAVLGRVGSRAFRRPLTDAEKTRLGETFRALRASWSFGDSLRGVLVALLTSPTFVHRAEIGQPAGGRRRLGSYELASAIAYGITDGPPDDALMAAAQTDRLAQPSEVEAQIDRLLASGQVDGLANFFNELLGADWVLHAINKDRMQFPFFTDAVPPRLLASFMREARRLVSDPAATLGEYLTSPRAFVDKTLAPIFGSPSTATDLEPRDVGRAGLFTHPAFLATHGEEQEAKPLFRARAVLERALCVRLPPPPPEAANTPLVEDPALTFRQSFERMTSTPMCIGCHRMLNPLSHPFEAYDTTGRAVTRDRHGPVDPAGEAPIGGTTLRFADARSLFETLAERAEVRQCFATNWMSYLYGRDLVGSDSCAVRNAFAAFERGGWKISALVRAVLAAEDFRLREGP